MTFKPKRPRNPFRRKPPTQPIYQVIDDLWIMALDVAIDDAPKFETLREAIAYLETIRNA